MSAGFDERVVAERIAGAVNRRLAPLAREVEQLRNELLKVRGEVEVFKRDAVRSVSEALLNVKVSEAFKIIEPRLLSLEKRIASLEGCMTELNRKQTAMIELFKRVLEPDEDITALLAEIRGEVAELGKRLEAPRAALSDEDRQLLLKAINRLSGVADRLESAAESQGSLAPLLEKLVAAIQGLQTQLSNLNERLDEILEDLGDVHERVEFIYEAVRKWREEEGEGEEGE